ncbi:HAD-IIIA family hydrolase [Achromobacter xylosoxidans]|uniref:HAD-IIIA family hydrolase n=1 Tax=Alcaligenes xylosoxydans xylosoxydans TaxID=85698 RepID=UPI00291E26A1|nr:HAD-IIIA family hydrolase [Achromobacter xylosoxidans]BEG76750.1 UTP--glucose-1-phosphate uridylyltransferase [Achromobacter xylosoxidans]
MRNSIAPTQAVILVGGLGTRLGELTKSYPKPLLPVNGRPFLDLLLWHLARQGFEEILLLAGHCAEAVEEYARNCEYRDTVNIKVLTEPAPLGTAGALSFAGPHLHDTFLLMNGDSVFDFNLLDLHALLSTNPDCLVAMGLRQLSDASRFGIVSLDEEYVDSFAARGTEAGGLVNGGIYLIRREILQYVPERGSLEQEVLPLLASRRKVCARKYEGFFLDIGVPESYEFAATSVWQSMRRPAIIFDRDGVLNVNHGYVGEIERFDWTEDAIEAVKYANDLGYFTFVFTNQAGIARGYYTESAMHTLHKFMQDTLRAHGAHIDAFAYCPHHIDGVVPELAISCDCRKPNPGMLRELQAAWPIDSKGTLVIGDQPTDIQAAEAVGYDSAQYKGGSLSQFLKTSLV